MTPAEHREEALRLLAAGREYHPAAAQRLTLATEAQVHATLSLREAPEPLAEVTSPAPEKKPAPRKRTPARKSPATPKETPAP